ncbi:hypothetical protein D7X98_04210 [bacterium 1XD8-76]|nr:hypothetical protein D7X98_04210 [bacterium 1XD8-76]
MAKDYVKGVNIEEKSAMGEEKDAQEVKEYESNEEETKEMIRANEEDFIQGLIDAANYASDETQRIDIIRDGRLFFSFHIRPLGSEEYEKCRKKHTKYVRNKQLGMRVPDETNRVKYQSAVIYEATIEEDKAKLWDNRKIWEALNAKKDRIMNGLDVIEYSLKAGEKERIIEKIDEISGYDNNLEEVAKN